jgi:hypothetical protein
VVIDSADQFDEMGSASLVFSEVVLHPSQTGPFGGSVRAFEEIAALHPT